MRKSKRERKDKETKKRFMKANSKRTKNYQEKARKPRAKRIMRKQRHKLKMMLVSLEEKMTPRPKPLTCLMMSQKQI